MTATICPACQTPIPADAPGGFCPACVLRGVEETTLQPSAGAPPIDTVRAAFPELEIENLIGQGGMGFVYVARQPSLDRTVALKILSPALSKDPAFAERFAREARVLGKLSHPNIVTVYEHGQRGGFYYLLMEYVDGVNLRQAMRAGKFTPQQALAVVPGICDALQAAHAQGIWHRDIKPENILLDARGGVKIADFGIARLAADPQQAFTLTMTGARLGSAAYMAPEQHEKPHDVDHRADIYSLGVVIYEMLTGELPLGRFPNPSAKAAVDARIDEIVLRTLEKERELRQQSAQEVKTDVARASAEPMATGCLPMMWSAADWFLSLAARKDLIISEVALAAGMLLFTSMRALDSLGSKTTLLLSSACLLLALLLKHLETRGQLWACRMLAKIFLLTLAASMVSTFADLFSRQSLDRFTDSRPSEKGDISDAQTAPNAGRPLAPRPPLKDVKEGEPHSSPEDSQAVPPAPAPLPDVKEAFLAMNRLANTQDAAAFRDLLTESYQKRSAPLAGTMEFFYGTPVQTKVIAFTAEVRRLLFGNTPAKTEVFVALQQKDGSLKYQQLEFRMENGGWKFAGQNYPTYRARVRIAFRPPTGDALSILRAHVSDGTTVEPVPETAGEFQLCHDTIFDTSAHLTANTKATDLDASLEKAGLGSHYQILRPAAPPTLPLHAQEEKTTGEKPASEPQQR